MRSGTAHPRHPNAFLSLTLVMDGGVHYKIIANP